MPRDLFGNWIKADMLGRRISKKQLNREKMDEIRRKGRAGEDTVRMQYELQGYRMERTGRGHDFKATRQDILTGRKESKYVEVKTGNSQLSRLQSKTKSRGVKYKVERVEPFFY